MTTDVTFNHHTVPVINERSVNSTTKIFDGIHISFDPRASHYGSATTAIVLDQRVFFVLSGDHRTVLAEAARTGKAQDCIDYFIENLAQANHLSEHFMVIGEAKDHFELTPTAIEVIGQENIDRLALASKALKAAA